MTKQPRTSELHRALQLVHRNEIEFHTVDGPGEGFTRKDCVRLNIDDAISLLTLWRTQLIAILDPRGILDRIEHVRPVSLTADGAAALVEWSYEERREFR